MWISYQPVHVIILTQKCSPFIREATWRHGGCSHQLKIVLKATPENGFSAKFILSPSLSETSFSFAGLFARGHPYQKTEIFSQHFGGTRFSFQPVHVIGLSSENHASFIWEAPLQTLRVFSHRFVLRCKFISRPTLWEPSLYRRQMKPKHVLNHSTILPTFLHCHV